MKLDNSLNTEIVLHSLLSHSYYKLLFGNTVCKHTVVAAVNPHSNPYGCYQIRIRWKLAPSHSYWTTCTRYSTGS